ncbi:hypothetical protein N9A35_00280, partial [bacterium]|nr:hypothetical protein [bacterium]
MISIYKVLSTLIYPFLFIYIYYRKILKKEHPKRFKEKILSSHFNVVRKKDSKLIWFHAASIGEFKSILPIIEELNINNTNLEFLVTTTTLSSSIIAEKELKIFKNVFHRFFPFDVHFLMDNFLASWRPNVIFLVDSEIWPNLILKTKKYNVPLALINARITSSTFKKWMKFPTTAKKIFSSFNLCLASNLETKDFLSKLNANNIFFNGNIKLVSKFEKKKTRDINDDFLIKNKFWVAASTHDGEDVFCLDVHTKLKETYKGIVTIIAPRHINRTKNIETLCKNYNFNVQILNKNDKILENKEIVIINSFGVLQNFFKYTKSAFIGKSIIKKFKNTGGQNPIEAAKLDCKIYHGPYVYNFKEIYNILEKNNISKVIEDSKEL